MCPVYLAAHAPIQDVRRSCMGATLAIASNISQSIGKSKMLYEAQHQNAGTMQSGARFATGSW